MIKLEMENYSMILIEKLQKYQPYRQAKLIQYEYLTGKEILSFNQKQIVEQAKFTYSLLGESLEKQIKNIEYQGEKQVKVIQNQGKIKTTESNKNVGNESSKIFDELSLKKLVK